MACMAGENGGEVMRKSSLFAHAEAPRPINTKVGYTIGRGAMLLLSRDGLRWTQALKPN